MFENLSIVVAVWESTVLPVVFCAVCISLCVIIAQSVRFHSFYKCMHTPEAIPYFGILRVFHSLSYGATKESFAIVVVETSGTDSRDAFSMVRALLRMILPLT